MLRVVGNVTLPTPVFVAGGALCVLAGYLVGTVATPGLPERTTATVVSFDTSQSRLCLQGDGVTGQEGVDSQGVLCGTLQRTPAAVTPRRGEKFRFVSVSQPGEDRGKKQQQVVIYGDVVG
ncbi:MAG: hypothetical protein JWR20_2219 [Marmoricola sp.]|nr:hypothetical protein [Marmoricola sp.]